jgi:hypothetical protein
VIASTTALAAILGFTGVYVNVNKSILMVSGTTLSSTE